MDSAEFDIASLDTVTAGQAGAPMTLINPKTGAPMRDSGGDPVTITLKGRHSREYRAKQTEIQERRADREARGIRSTREDTEAEDIEILTCVTVTWTIQRMDGQPFPPTQDNIQRLWNDPRFVVVRDQAIRFILQDGNFMPTTSPAS